MTAACLFQTTIVVVLALAQMEQPGIQLRSPAADLLYPKSGAALSLRQVEERTSQGDSAVEVITSSVYRDSAGRLRIDSESRRNSNEPSFSRVIIDPLAGLRVGLLSEKETAYRIVGPKLGEDGLALGVAGLGEGLEASHKWQTTMEDLGKRRIDGAEFTGTRVVQTAQDNSGMRNTIEKWYSSDLGLTALAEAVGPYGHHSARIEDLRFGEPDPNLFSVPSHYKILDINLRSETK